FHYIPFGQGPHICIGNRLAQIEIQLIAIRLLRKFKFIFESPRKSIPELNPEAIISSKKAVRVVIEKR
ncbi:MAG TPA: cytochrome P450, partial [Ignavibacteriaceae bacterium]|nr:cytochrome P450 [Ignavibacteriaceae bacterium]